MISSATKRLNRLSLPLERRVQSEDDAEVNETSSADGEVDPSLSANPSPSLTTLVKEKNS